MIKRMFYTAFAAAALGVLLTGPTSAGEATQASAPVRNQAQVALPQPTPPFKGKIGKTYKDSVADFPQPVQAPTGTIHDVTVEL